MEEVMAFDMAHGENDTPERVYWVGVGKETTLGNSRAAYHSKSHREYHRRALLSVKSETTRQSVRRVHSTHWACCTAVPYDGA